MEREHDARRRRRGKATKCEFKSYLPALNRRSARRDAFTFLEIMAVVVIIGILSALVGQGISHRVIQARITTCQTQLDTLSVALHQFELDIGRLPEESEGLVSLIEPPSNLPEDTWHGPYLDSDVVPTDPWKNEYQYRAPGEHRVEFDLWSLGPDRQDGTDDDIGNWTRKTRSP